ncbi:MAG TPA: ABC transporter substrate-binding protein [Acidobacteriota bacterium]|nr:ABC transporter substrate-binding protein [Acidobacteriota bacterium]
MTNGRKIPQTISFTCYLRIVVCLPLLAASVSSCGGGSTDDGRTVVRVVTWKPDYPHLWDTALARFHRANPDIRIAREIGPQNSTQLHDLLTQKLRNRDVSVDAFLMDVIWTAEFARAGWAAPLDDRFPPEERAQFFAGCIAADVVGDGIYGVPFNTDSGVLYYRTDLLDKYGFAPPRTWPELVDQVDSILAGEDDPRLSGYSGQFRQYEGLVCNMLEFVGANGGDLLAPSTPEVIAAVEFVRDRIIAGVAPRGVLTYQEQESLDLFASGGAIFHRNWPYAWAVCRETAMAGKVGIARLPTFKPGMSTAALGGWRFGVSAFSQHPDEAWRVVAFLTSPEMQELFAVEGGKAPARRALYQDADVLGANPHFAALYDVFETATPRPRSPIYPELSHILQRFLHAAIADTLSEIPALAHQAAVAIQTAQARID